MTEKKKYERVQLFTDGASRGNGSQDAEAAIAGRILDEKGNELVSFAECIGCKTNNQAEYMAIAKGLELAKEYTCGRIDCYSDSNLVVNQMAGNWKVNDKKLARIRMDALLQTSEFREVTYNHLKRVDPRIVIVDDLANQVLDEE